MFKAIARLLSGRKTPAPHPRQAVADFRARKRAEGLTETEISAILVASRITSEAVFIVQGRSDKEIDSMNWGYLFQFPPAPLPVRGWVVYPNDWRIRQDRLRREGYSEGIIHEVLQGVGEWQRLQTQPPSFWGTRPQAEPLGSRAESLARLMEQGYTENEVRQIFDARLRASGGMIRYPHLEEEGGIVWLLARHKKTGTASRPALRLVVNNAPAPN